MTVHQEEQPVDTFAYKCTFNNESGLEWPVKIKYKTDKSIKNDIKSKAVNTEFKIELSDCAVEVKQKWTSFIKLNINGFIYNSFV